MKYNEPKPECPWVKISATEYRYETTNSAGRALICKAIRRHNGKNPYWGFEVYRFGQLIGHEPDGKSWKNADGAKCGCEHFLPEYIAQ